MSDIARLPKAELHCHLDGIVHPQILRELQTRGVNLPMMPGELEAAYPVRTFTEFVRWFQTADPCEGDLDFMTHILSVHLERLKGQNVRYAEFMIASSEIPRDRTELLERFRRFHDAVDELTGDALQVEFLAIFSRARAPEQLADLIDRILLLHEAGLIAGVGLAGPEQGYPVKPFERIFARCHEAGLGIEIHAGEWVGPESVWDALQHGYPDRIGHGVAVFQDPRLVRHFLDKQIHIEMCPTSNCKTGSVARIADHPVRLARAHGMNFSINTDDPGAFECSLNSEYDLLTQEFGFDEVDFARIYQNTLSARFHPKG